MANALTDVITEMRNDLREVKKLLVGNGAIGLSEFTRATRADLDELTGQVKEIATTVGQIANGQRDHQQWHERPENLTLQQMLNRSGIRFAMVVGVVLVAVVLIAMGVDQAKVLLQAWL